MYILERSITKPYWEASYKFIARRLAHDDTRRVAPGTWCIQGTGVGNRRYYAYFKNTEHGYRPVAWLLLEYRASLQAYGVEQVWTFPEHRDKGLALRLYRAAVDVDGLTIASGRSHTKYSKAFWEKLIRLGTFKIWAQQTGSGASPRKHKVEWCRKTKQVQCKTQLYTQYKKPDTAILKVRLYAKRKTK